MVKEPEPMAEGEEDKSATENYADDENGERMMLSPSSDFFDDDEEDYDEDYDENNEESSDGEINTTEKLKANSDDDSDEDDRDFMNEEGSGGYKYAYSRYRNNLYNKDRLRLDYIEKYRKKHQKQHKSVPGDDEDDDVTIRREGSGNFDASDDEDDDDDFFASKRKSNSKYFRKNTNDAIKIISTPHGKVGIVYQQTDNASEKKSKGLETNLQVEKKPQHKITPVLTADGKVALLYRGASENTKYEPILNLTHTFNYDNKTSAVNNAKSIYDKDDDSKDIETSTMQESPEPTTTTTIGPILGRKDNEHDNPILPIINRPLSEVLGIKKNQFKQFRIKDTPTTVSTTEMERPTTIDLKKYPRPSYDYDFGIDVTEYDDRNDRYNQLDGNGPPKLGESTNPTLSTSEILSKTEVVNLAIIPHFDEEFERQQHYREHETTRRHHRQRHRYRHLDEDLSGVHCIMQAMMGIAAISTVFGMLGAFFKQRILDQIRMMHW